jgi:protein LSM14
MSLFKKNKVTIISKSEIRYEGYMHDLNLKDKMITLSEVISFGTEGRRPGNEIAPSQVVYEYI